MFLISKDAQQAFYALLVLWPIALLTPFLPGIPSPRIVSLPWRQELVISVLVFVSCLVIAAKRSNPLISLRGYTATLLTPLALFVTWSAISSLWAASVFAALYYSCLWGLFLLFFLLSLCALRHRALLRVSLISLAFVTSALALLCVAFFWGGGKSKYEGLTEPLAIAVSVFSALALGVRPKRDAALWAVPAVLGWVAIVMAAKRAPFIAASIALLALFLMMSALPRFRVTALKRSVLLLLVVTAATGIYLVRHQTEASLFSRLRATGAAEQNARVRLLLWKVGIEIFRAHPLKGVGANNYETAFPEARASFAAKERDSPLVPLGEESLVQRAHNEFIQILAELGIVGLSLFAAFCLVLLLHASRALKHDRSPLTLGAISSLLAFTISSIASSLSFRWAGSGFLFFYAAALIARAPLTTLKKATPSISFIASHMRRVKLGMALMSLVCLSMVVVHTMSVSLAGAAEASKDPKQSEKFFQAALRWNPFHAATRFSYGLWLYGQGRMPEAVTHLRYATDRGFNASFCYGYLASAEMQTGDVARAEKTLAYAVRVYPRSIFLRVDHAATLMKIGEIAAAEQELATARAINSRMARGWWLLIDAGYTEASMAAKEDPQIATPEELHPQNCLPTVTICCGP